MLPFRNYDPGGTGEHLADGMTEELISALSKVPDLQVTSRTSAFAMKEKQGLALDIAKELRVAMFLEGSVRSVKEELRVSVRLVDASNGYKLWSEQYIRPGRDVLGVQVEIADAVVRTLRLTLSPEVRGRLTKGPTKSPEAYNLYVQDRFFWNKRTPADHRKAVSYFTAAIAEDSTFALAYSGLADTYTIQAQNNASPRPLLLKARDAANTSLRLDSLIAESHASAGVVGSFLTPRDSGNTLASLRRAIALDSTYAAARQWYAIVLATVGRVEEAIREGQHAVRLNPRGVPINQGYGLVLYLSGRFADAEAQFRATLLINPESKSAQNRLAHAVAAQGRFAEAVEIARATNRRVPVDVQSRGTLGYVLARAGRSNRRCTSVTVRPVRPRARGPLGGSARNCPGIGAAAR